MVVMLKQCCCGCTLRTGALIIAVVFAILSALLVVLFSVGAVASSDEHFLLVRDHRERQTEAPERQHATTTTTTAAPASTPDPAEELEDYGQVPRLSLSAKITVLKFWMCLTVLLTLAESLDFLLSVLLMFAADKDSARHVRLWLVSFCAVSCCRTLLLLVLNVVIFYASPLPLGFFVLAIFTLLTGGTVYSLLVVLSYYRRLVGTAIARRISQQDD